MMKPIYYKILGWALSIGMLFVGTAYAQTNTETFDNGSCVTVATCGTPGGILSTLEQEGDKFFFYEILAINGVTFTHIILRDKGDDAGGTWQQETWTKGIGFFSEQGGTGIRGGAGINTSIGSLTMRQVMNIPGNNSEVVMDNLNLIDRSTVDLVGLGMKISQNITDPTFGLITNEITMIPDPAFVPSTDFSSFPNFDIHVNQRTTGPGGHDTVVEFDVGDLVTPNQDF